jgi:hypothetical protein
VLGALFFDCTWSCKAMMPLWCYIGVDCVGGSPLLLSFIKNSTSHSPLLSEQQVLLHEGSLMCWEPCSLISPGAAKLWCLFDAIWGWLCGWIPAPTFFHIKYYQPLSIVIRTASPLARGVPNVLGTLFFDFTWSCKAMMPLWSYIGVDCVGGSPHLLSFIKHSTSHSPLLSEQQVLLHEGSLMCWEPCSLISPGAAKLWCLFDAILGLTVWVDPRTFFLSYKILPATHHCYQNSKSSCTRGP